MLKLAGTATKSSSVVSHTRGSDSPSMPMWYWAPIPAIQSYRSTSW
jgi:hypothetical protein